MNTLPVKHLPTVTLSEMLDNRPLGKKNAKNSLRDLPRACRQLKSLDSNQCRVDPPYIDSKK